MVVSRLRYGLVCHSGMISVIVNHTAVPTAALAARWERSGSGLKNMHQLCAMDWQSHVSSSDLILVLSRMHVNNTGSPRLHIINESARIKTAVYQF